MNYVSVLVGRYTGIQLCFAFLYMKYITSETQFLISTIWRDLLFSYYNLSYANTFIYSMVNVRTEFKTAEMKALTTTKLLVYRL